MLVNRYHCVFKTTYFSTSGHTFYVKKKNKNDANTHHGDQNNIESKVMLSPSDDRIWSKYPNTKLAMC